MRRLPLGPATAAVAIMLVGLMAGTAIVLGALSFVRTRERAVQVAQNALAAAQQNVRARYDDCQAGNQLRVALTAQVQEGKLTEPLLYKLVPSLDTPEVHRIIADQRNRQLRAYRPRDCHAYALSAIPPALRGEYHAP